MNDRFASRFIKGVLSTGIGTSATIALGFVSVMVAVRAIPKEQFGAYILVQVIVSFFMMAADMGMNTSATKFIAGGGEARVKQTVDTVAGFKSALVLVVSSGILCCGPLMDHVFKPGELSGLVVYISVLFALESFNAFFSAVLQGLHYYKKLAGAQVMLSAVNFACIMAFVAWMGLGLPGLIYARAASLAFAIAYQYKVLPFNTVPGYDGRLFREVFAFGFPLGLNSVLTFVFTKMDTLIIAALMSPLGVAYYGAASKIPDAGRQMFNSFRSVYFPSMSELYNQGRPREAEQVLNRSLRAVGFASAAAALSVFMFQDDIVRLLFSEKYMESAPALTVLMLALGAGLAGNVLGTTLVCSGHPRLPVMINVVDAAVNVGANLVLVPMYGIMGAAYAALLARVATGPVNVWSLKRTGVRVDVSEILKPAGVLGACMVLYLAAGSDTLAARALVATLFLAGCAALAVVTPGDFKGLARGLTYHTGPADVTRT